MCTHPSLPEFRRKAEQRCLQAMREVGIYIKSDSEGHTFLEFWCLFKKCLRVCVHVSVYRHGVRGLPRVLVLFFHVAGTGILFIPVHTRLAGPRVSEDFPGSSSISQWKCSEYRCVLSNSAWTWVLRSKLKSSPLCGKHLSPLRHLPCPREIIPKNLLKKTLGCVDTDYKTDHHRIAMVIISTTGESIAR